MHFIKKFIVVISLFILISCDHMVGQRGVVENELTGERIENVEVSLFSEPADLKVYTDFNGYFNATKSYKCGPLERCSPNFTLTFKKQGFQSTSINVDYHLNPTTEFVNQETKDTLIVKMKPNLNI